MAERPYQLLVYLAARGDWVGRDQLAALFWPDQGNTVARRNLRKVLHGARHLEFAHAVETRGDLVRWPCATDVQEFDLALKEGCLAAAVALVRGPLGEGLDDALCAGFTEWLAFERNRLTERWRTAALALLPQLPPAAVLDLADRLLAADPYDDEALRAKLGALVVLDRRADARRVYRRFAEHLAEELGVEPNVATRTLAATLNEQASPPLVAGSAKRVPALDSQLFGREREVEELLALLVLPDTRLVTITGPGGVGKTRVAQAVVTRVTGHFRGGALWINLDDLVSAEGISARLASALHLALKPDADALSQVARSFGESHALLVLDNSEHLVGATEAQGLAAIVTTLIAACPRLVVLVTSRVRLLARDERLLPLAGLATPNNDEPSEAILATPAAQLFCARAGMTLASFDPASQASGIAAICRLTEGLPLALELAAAWSRLMSCAEIAAELRSGLDVLEARAGSRGVRAAFERSWQLVAPHERDVLANLSVFSGTFAREAARAVAEASLPSLANLVDASLLRVEQDAAGARYGLHPLLREFAREKLGANLRADRAACARHAAYFANFLARYGDFERTDQKTALADVERELENCTAAWRWAASNRDTDLIALAVRPLKNFLERRGRALAGMALFEAALSELDERVAAHLPVLGEIAAALGALQFRVGRLEPAEASARRALHWAKSSGRRETFAPCLNTIGLSLWQRGRYQEARRFFGEALKLARAAGDADGVAAAIGRMAMVDKALGNNAAAEAAYREALDLRRAAGNAVGLTNILNNLGNLLRLSGRCEEALPLLEEGAALCDAQGLRNALPFFLTNLGLTHYQLKQYASAHEYCQRAASIAHEVNEPQMEIAALGNLAQIATTRGDTRAARKWLSGAMRVALAAGGPVSQIEMVSCFAELLVAEGQARRAATIWTFVAAQDRLEFVSRHEASEMRARLALDAQSLENAEREAANLGLQSLVNEVLNAAGDLSGTHA